MKKVLIVGGGLGGGGKSIMIREMAERMREAGHEVEVDATFNRQPKREPDFIVPDELHDRKAQRKAKLKALQLAAFTGVNV